jgi:hypothetical protein
MTLVADDRRTWDEPAFVAVVLASLSVALLTAWVAAAAMGVHHQRYDAAQLAIAILARETAALLTLTSSPNAISASPSWDSACRVSDGVRSQSAS